MRKALLLLITSLLLTGAGGEARLPYETPELSPVAAIQQSFVYPVMGPRRSSKFGMRIHPVKRFSRHHNGIDLAAPVGAPIRSVAGGTVVFADPFAGYGNFVVVQHGRGVTTHYGHCDKLYVQPGQKVLPGQIIATVGNTGMSTGPHLHFELRLNGKAQDPERYFPGLASRGDG